MEKYRKNLRLRGFDYSDAGYYFVTICTHEKRCVLSNIIPGTEAERARVQLTELGQIATKRIHEEANRCGIHVSASVVMPNHIHLLLESSGVCALGRYVGIVKSTTAYQWRQTGRNDPAQKLWQRNYYEHVIRNKEDFLEKWKYIDENPDKWVLGQLD